MSLWCGNCKNAVTNGFGLLYKFERTESGELKYPDKKKDYVPPNSAICDTCWRRFPRVEKFTDAASKNMMEAGRETVYAYASAESNYGRDGIKTWSGIVANESKTRLVFLTSDAVEECLPGAVEIIGK